MTPPRLAEARQHGCPHEDCRERFLREQALLVHLDRAHGEALRGRYSTGREVMRSD